MQASTEWKNREKAKASESVVVLETLIGKGEQDLSLDLAHQSK